MLATGGAAGHFGVAKVFGAGRGGEVVHALAPLLHPSSLGSFHHLSLLLPPLIRHSFTTTLPALSSPLSSLPPLAPFSESAPAFQGPGSLPRRLLPYFADQGAVRAAVVALTCGGVDGKHKEVRDAMESWRAEDVVGEALRLVASPDSSLSLGAAEFTVRLADETAKLGPMAPGATLFEPAVERAGEWVVGVVELLTSKTASPTHHRAALLVLHGLTARRTYEGAVKPFTEGAGQGGDDDGGAIGGGNDLGGLREAVLKALGARLPDLCNALQLSNFKGEVEGSIALPAYHVKKPFTYLRMQVLEILHEIVRDLAQRIVEAKTRGAEGDKESEAQVPDPFTSLPWKVLVNWFFEYKHNSQYLSLFYKLFHLLLHHPTSSPSQPHPSLRSVLTKCKLLPRVVEHFNDRAFAELRGYMILVLNEVRLGAEREPKDGYLRSVLGSLQGWEKVAEQLRAATQKQVAPVYTFKIPQIPRPAPWVGPVSSDAISVAEKRVGDGKGIDLGSDYALSLGFMPTPPPTSPAPSTPTKKPPPGPVLSPDEIARTFLPDTVLTGQGHGKKKGKKRGGKAGKDT
ncbi:hypothetical protein M427DRAFT_316110 [Gonapodya prolifera JEL478]|uniref:Uncharacterized protein n=1 Tax=Gonapodya prolifera (strain JEL478) TaxID=1344416 RepID=A0A139AX78_GONPJ|nr:hypothetical protein M427DRAFT_316110 [Gonapodya prolifera JEL478]|eukprot:KXS21309.1 hypothetical protein M427DRAFT_316110 [Gonapodya prolifera JEL478]